MSPIQFAVLMCGQPIPSIKAAFGDFGQIYTRFLSQSLARITSEVSFTVDSYDVQEMEYPPEDIQYDCLLISASRYTAYEDVKWVNKLAAYIKRIVTDKPSLKIFGSCFGHEIVARALGGSCAPNNGHWEVSMTPIQLTPLGEAIFGADELDLYEIHRDHISRSPPNAHLLGWSDITSNQIMVVFDPESAPLPENISSDAPYVDLTSIHVLTFQGHPEFTEPLMSMLLDARAETLGPKLLRDARLRLGGIPGKRYPDGYDGVSKVGEVIWGVLGVF